MRGARAGFVLKVNILYITAHPVLERFLLPTKWAASYVSSDEVCTHRGAHAAYTQIHTCTETHTGEVDAHTRPHRPAHTLTCRRPWIAECVTLFFCFFDGNANSAERLGIHLYFSAVPFNPSMPLLINSFSASNQSHFCASQLVTLALIKAPIILQRSIIRTKAGGVTRRWHTRHTLEGCLCNHISFKPGGRKKTWYNEERLSATRYAHPSKGSFLCFHAYIKQASPFVPPQSV